MAQAQSGDLAGAIWGRRGRGYTPLTTGRRPGTLVAGQPFPDPPPGWPGTLPEWGIYWAHQEIGLKEGVDFAYRLGWFGYDLQLTGGIQVDFYEFDPGLAVNIQGFWWHYGFSGWREVIDLDQRIRLESIGIPVVYIDEDDVLRSPVFYLREALVGREYSVLARGGS